MPCNLSASQRGTLACAIFFAWTVFPTKSCSPSKTRAPSPFPAAPRASPGEAKSHSRSGAVRAPGTTLTPFGNDWVHAAMGLMLPRMKGRSSLIVLCSSHMSNQYLFFKRCSVNIYVALLKIRGTVSVSILQYMESVSFDSYFMDYVPCD